MSVILRFAVATLWASVMLAAAAASGQEFPNKPIRTIASSPGGSNDFVARIIAQGLAASLGQQVLVENRGGGNGIIAVQTVAKAPPDGYTLLNFSGGIWLLPFMQSVPYDPVKDLSPITLTVTSPSLLVVHSSLPVKSVKALIALAKARPGELNYAAGSSGATPHLAAELFKAMAGIDVVRIPYKGTAAALNALLSGQVHVAFGAPAAVMPHVKAGRVRALAVTSAQRSAMAPDLPTIASSGLPDYEAVASYGMWAPAKTPTPIIQRLNQEIVRVLNQPNVKEKFIDTGVEVVGSSPEQFAAAIKSDMARMGKVIKEAGISAE